MPKISKKELCNNRITSKYKMKDLKKMTKISPMENKRYKKTWINEICNEKLNNSFNNNISNSSITLNKIIKSKNKSNKAFNNRFNQTCMGLDNKYDVNFGKCNPEFNALMANDNVKLENLHKENTGKDEVSRIIQLSDNTCFDINELAHWIIGNGNRNPYAPDRKIWDSRDDLDRILYHPKLESNSKNELDKLYPDIDSDMIYETIMKHIDVFYILGEVGLILLSDYKDEEFKDSLDALIYLGTKIDALDENDRQVFFNLKSKNGISLRKTIEDASGNCIHTGGFIISSIYSKYYLDAKTKMLQKSGKYIGIIHPGYCFVGDGTNPKSLANRNHVLYSYLCPYAESRLQICYYSEISIDSGKYGRILRANHNGEKVTRFFLNNQIFGYTRDDCIKLLGNINRAYDTDLLLKDCFNYYLKVRNPPDEQLMSLIKKNRSFFSINKITDKHKMSIHDYVTFKIEQNISKSGFFIRFEHKLDIDTRDKCIIKVKNEGYYKDIVINISQITNILNGYKGLTFKELEQLYQSIAFLDNGNNNIGNNNIGNNNIGNNNIGNNNIGNNNSVTNNLINNKNNQVDILLKDMINNNLPTRNIEELVYRYFSEDIIRPSHFRHLDDVFTKEFDIIYKNYTILYKKIEDIKHDILKETYDKFQNYFKTAQDWVDDDVDNKKTFYYIYDYYFQEFKNFLEKYKEKLNLLRIEVNLPIISDNIPESEMYIIMVNTKFISHFIQIFEINTIISEHQKNDPEKKNIKIWKVLDKIKDVDEFSKTLHTYYTEMHKNIKTEVSNKIIEFTDICLLLQNTKVFINELKQHYGKKKTAEVENKLKNNVINQKNNVINQKNNVIEQTNNVINQTNNIFVSKPNKIIEDIMKFRKYDLIHIINKEDGDYSDENCILLETRRSKIEPKIVFYKYYLKDEPSKVKEITSQEFIPILINRLSDNKRKDVDKFAKRTAYNFIREYYDYPNQKLSNRIGTIEQMLFGGISKGTNSKRIDIIYTELIGPLKLKIKYGEPHIKLLTEFHIKLINSEMLMFGDNLNNRDHFIYKKQILKSKNFVKDITKLNKYDLIKLSDKNLGDYGIIVSKISFKKMSCQILLWKGLSNGWIIENINPENVKFLLRGLEPNKSNNKVEETVLAELYREILESDYDFEENQWKTKNKNLIYKIEREHNDIKSKKNNNNLNNNKTKKNSIPKINQVNLLEPKYKVHKLRKQFYKPMNEKTQKYFTLFRGDPQTSRKVLLLMSEEYLFKDFTTIIEKVGNDFKTHDRLVFNPRFLMRSKNLKHKGENLLKNNSKIFHEYYNELENYNKKTKIFDKKNETMLYIDDLQHKWTGYLPGDLITEGVSIDILGTKLGKNNPMYFNNHDILFNHVTNWMPFEYFDKGAGLSYSDFTIKAFERCMESEKRYIIFILTIRIQSGGYHANAMIMDRHDKTIVRFEPNGKGFKIYDHNDLDEQFRQFITGENPSLTPEQSESIKIIFKDVKYITPNMYQGNRGPQAIETMLSGIKYIQGQTDGFCAAWSMYFIHLFLYNNSKEHRVSAPMICEFLENRDAGKELGPNIRGYMAFLVEYIERHKLLLPQIKNDGEGNNDWN